jgi:hypothetical protein
MGILNKTRRAESSLGAERNTAELQSKASTLAGQTDSPDSSPQGRKSYTQTKSPALSRRASHIPAVPSPLNPASSQSSIGDSDEVLALEMCHQRLEQ